MMTFQSAFMLDTATLEDVVAEGQCKAVMAHPHFQQRIDEVREISLRREEGGE